MYKLTEIAQKLGPNKWVEVAADEERLQVNRPVREVLEPYGNDAYKYLQSIVDQYNPQVLVVRIGDSNGNRWKNPKQYVHMCEAEQRAVAAENPIESIANSPVMLKGLARQGDTSPILEAKNSMLYEDTIKTRGENAELKAENKSLKKENEALERQNKNLQYEKEDTERKLTRKIDDIERESVKPDLIDRLTANPQLLEMGLGLLTKAGEKQALNGPQLSEPAQKVVQAMQAQPSYAPLLQSFINLLQKEGFYAEFQALQMKFNTQVNNGTNG